MFKFGGRIIKVFDFWRELLVFFFQVQCHTLKSPTLLNSVLDQVLFNTLVLFNFDQQWIN